MDYESPKIAATTGVILAGGQSTRFGSNKALARLHGKSLIGHIADTLRGLFSSCLLVTNSPELFKFLDLPSTGDIFQAAGPLGGLHAALQYISAPKAFVVGCDMPMLNPDLIRFLCRLSAAEEWDAVIPWLKRGPEPLCGVYSKNALPIIERNLRKNERQLIKTITDLKVRQVSETEILTVVNDLKTFHNINRLEDLFDLT